MCEPVKFRHLSGVPGGVLHKATPFAATFVSVPCMAACSIRQFIDLSVYLHTVLVKNVFF